MSKIIHNIGKWVKRTPGGPPFPTDSEGDALKGAARAPIFRLSPARPMRSTAY
jgi:hypothetical protein